MAFGVILEGSRDRLSRRSTLGHRWLRHLAECIVASMHIWGTSSADLHHRGCDCPIAPYDSHSMTMWSSSISAVHFNSACTKRLRTDHVTRPCCLFTRWASRHQHDSDGGDLSSQLNTLQTHTLNARCKRPFQTQTILRECRTDADSNAVSNAVSNAQAGCRA